MQTAHKRVSVPEIALGYAGRGWSTVPIPYRRKRPLISDWQNLRIAPSDISRYFGPTRLNIGVLLGEPSQWLIDVDLDHPLARPIAENALPATGCVFGRVSNPRSHWLYYASCPIDTRQWHLPDRKMVVELRSTGAQTVFPGSVHECGEPIEWDRDSTPTVIDPTGLTEILQCIHERVCDELSVPSASVHTTNHLSLSAPRSVIERARKYLFKIQPAISGQGGHQTTYLAACRMVLGFGLDRSDALALLCEWNEHCQPSWTLKELEHKVDDALQEPGWRGYLLNSLGSLAAHSVPNAIERANRHAIEHRRRTSRRAVR